MLCAYTYCSTILLFVNIHTHRELGLFLVSFECGFLMRLINYYFIFCTRLFYLKRGAFIQLLLCLECGVFIRIHYFFSTLVFVISSQSQIPTYYPLREKNIMNRVKNKKNCMFLWEKKIYLYHHSANTPHPGTLCSEYFS